ncbi:MAG: phosphate acyltransferase PlsX [Oscillospiraceae bacterium]|nr:phosphate acyltransferase PlsX [Oscillospiraceae bacterium]
MKIIADAMGGDNAPDEIVLGAFNAAKNLDVDIVLVGREESILGSMKKLGIDELPKRVEIVDAPEVVLMEDDPATVIRVKKQSSLNVGLTMLRDGAGDAFVSAGSTGALLSGATLITKRVRGLRRAALAPVLPSKTGKFVLIDCGANSDCTPEYLLQFAYMGFYYAEGVLKIKNPRVGLLNNGAESTKGTSLQLETYALLEKSTLNFVGNVESKDAMGGACDVLVSDGFTGNIFLKAVEGTASLLMSELKSVFMSTALTKISALIIKNKMRGLKDKLNPDLIGGTALLGISKPVIKAHGSSNAMAFESAIRQAIGEVGSNVASRLSKNVEQMKISSDE